jgi:hypothetical protein
MKLVRELGGFIFALAEMWRYSAAEVSGCAKYGKGNQFYTRAIQ